MIGSVIRPFSVLVVVGGICKLTFGVWFLLPFTVFLILLLDMGARLREYILLREKEWSHFVAYKFSKSWCKRGVAISRYGNVARAHYKAMGYRWYHILPERFLKSFYRINFWKQVVGL